VSAWVRVGVSAVRLRRFTFYESAAQRRVVLVHVPPCRKPRTFAMAEARQAILPLGLPRTEAAAEAATSKRTSDNQQRWGATTDTGAPVLLAWSGPAPQADPRRARLEVAWSNLRRDRRSSAPEFM